MTKMSENGLTSSSNDNDRVLGMHPAFSPVWSHFVLFRVFCKCAKCALNSEVSSYLIPTNWFDSVPMGEYIYINDHRSWRMSRCGEAKTAIGKNSGERGAECLDLRIECRLYSLPRRDGYSPKSLLMIFSQLINCLLDSLGREPCNWVRLISSYCQAQPNDSCD